MLHDTYSVKCNAIPHTSLDRVVFLFPFRNQTKINDSIIESVNLFSILQTDAKQIFSQFVL